MSKLSGWRGYLRAHPVAGALFALGSVVVVVFTLKTAMFALHWSDPGHFRATPEAWMTPGYLSHSWDVPVEQIIAALMVPDDIGHRPTLHDIARHRGVPVEQVLAEITAFLSERTGE